MMADRIEAKTPVVEDESANDALQEIVGKTHLTYALKARDGFTRTYSVI